VPALGHIPPGIAATKLVTQETIEIERTTGIAAPRYERPEQCLEIFTR
jgi:hypothetical protein